MKYLLPTEWATLLYIILTTLFACFLWPQMANPMAILTTRLCILVVMATLILIYRWRPNVWTRLFRHFFPLTLLGVWYPETYEFCRCFPYLDHLFAQADQSLFGCQPSLLFSQWLDGKVWSELFHLGYWAYYPMIVVTVFGPLAQFLNRRQTPAYYNEALAVCNRTGFVVLASFFLYYLIYIFVPVAGPHCYFHALGVEAAMRGEFADLGNYFATHTAMMDLPGPDGLFRSWVEMAHQSGECPTAAFPSSHVGIATILMLIQWRNKNRLDFCLLIPFYVFLCGATVYIHAHYLVDVFGGFATAFAFYYLCNAIYDRFFAKQHSFLTCQSSNNTIPS